jgi:hypothetical protein
VKLSVDINLMATDFGRAQQEVVKSGVSAREHANELQIRLQRVFCEAEQLTFEIRNFMKGANGERRLAEEVLAYIKLWRDAEWRMFSDRRWPGTESSNMDLILVGPPGVIVCDAKDWTETAVKNGRLLCGGFDASHHVSSIKDQARVVEGLLSSLGLPGGQVTPLLVLVNSGELAKKVKNCAVVGLSKLPQFLYAAGVTLTKEQIVLVGNALDRGLEPAHQQNLRFDSTEQASIEPESFREAVLKGAERGERATWMRWLHPAQAALTTAAFAGPARIRGAAGTGKTVVAIHRAHVMAQEAGQRVLVLAPTRTLSAVHRELLKQLAPDVVDRVEFDTIFGWAVNYLNRRGVTLPRIDEGNQAFNRAYGRTTSKNVLDSIAVSRDYWFEEIQHVIKGRGIVKREEYLVLDRRGRRVPLREAARLAMWDLYEKYQESLGYLQKCDWADVVTQARSELQNDPNASQYSSVIVDEVQDFSLNAVRLIQELSLDGTNSLLLVGDGRQQVFPGGFRLAEAGISIPGARSFLLEGNYRNGAAIAQRAERALLETDLPDLDDDEVSVRKSRCITSSGNVIERVFASRESMYLAMSAFVHAKRSDGFAGGTIAILVMTNREATDIARRLNQASIRAVNLRDFAGNFSDAVVVGTYDRSKGLEFPVVLLPGFAVGSVSQAGNGPEQLSERAELEAHRQYVAMTRAIDSLWIGRVRSEQ